MVPTDTLGDHAVICQLGPWTNVTLPTQKTNKGGGTMHGADGNTGRSCSLGKKR